MKIFLFPEYVCLLYAARKLNRPVKWIAERSEALLQTAMAGITSAAGRARRRNAGTRSRYRREHGRL